MQLLNHISSLLLYNLHAQGMISDATEDWLFLVLDRNRTHRTPGSWQFGNSSGTLSLIRKGL